MSAMPLALVITGPTASGKSALAKEVATHLPIEIISADSAQVYRGLDIGTAKPTQQERQETVHHLIDIRDPAEPYSAASFCQDAAPLAADIRRRNKVPMIVGGTMLYLKALKHGLNDLPEADAALRQEITDEANTKGWEELHKELANIDPQAAKRIQPNDPQRLQRAIEVYRLTGMTLSELQAQPIKPPPIKLVELAIIPPDRTALHQKIADRFHQMLASGFMEEVQQLYDRGDLNPSLAAIKSVGYRQAWAHLAGQMGLETMAEQAIAATRQLAKRQYTWLKSWQNLHQMAEPNCAQALKIIRAEGIL
ncbi:MAG: tRNA (adenosine(37)-N6)-dimethylallyltransferase MiaA [Pseudomonadales bacterium]